MNKSKIIIPLMLVAPALFACNKSDGIAGNYKVQYSGDIAHVFTKGDEESFKKTDFTKIDVIKTTIHDKLTEYMDGARTEDSTVRLSNEMGVEVQTANEGKTTIYPVNLRTTGESTMDMAFQYGKTASGYHFFGNYAHGYDNYEAYYRISSDIGAKERIEEVVADNGFKVKGKTLTAHFTGRFIKTSETEREVDYQIEFTVTATK